MKVRMKSMAELKKKVRAGEIELVHVSDSGEWMSYGVGKQPMTVKGFWWEDHEQEFLVVDHPNIISKDEYERLKPLFENVDGNIDE